MDHRKAAEDMEKAAEKQAPARKQPGEAPYQEEKISQTSLPNSLIMRVMELPEAEAEADRLSAGVRASTPAGLRQEMGSRLGADLSGVRFHSDGDSLRSGEQMNARAWTRGRDVYFGKGGFDSSIAAHELVHTVQQGAFSGSVSQHILAGSVQLWPWSKKRRAPEDDGPMDQYDKVDYFLKMQAGMAVDKYNRKIESGKQNLISTNDKNAYAGQIQSMSYEDYDELMTRMEDEAVKMADYQGNLIAENGWGNYDFNVINQEFGRNYKLYNSILNNVTKLVPAATLSGWRARRKRNIGKDPGRAGKLDTAAAIFNRMNSARGYQKAAGNVGAAVKGYDETEAYYRNVHQGKAGVKNKTWIDKLANIYRRVIMSRKNDFGGSGKKDSGRIRPEGDLIAQNDQIDNKSENPIGNIINNRIDDQSENVIGNDIAAGMAEKDQSLDSGAIGMDEKDILDMTNSDLNKSFNEKDLLDNNSAADERTDDPNAVVHGAGAIDENLVEDFVQSNSKIGLSKKAGDKAGLMNNVAKSINSAAQIGMVAEHSKDLSDKKIYTDFINPGVKGGAGLLGAVTGGIGVVSGIHDTYRGFKNLKAGGSKWDIATGGLDTVASGSAVGSGVLSMASAGSNLPVVGDTLKTIGDFGGSNFVPGLNVVTGGASAALGAVKSIRGQRSINKIDEQINKLSLIKKKNRTEDQKKMLKTFKQGKRAAEFQRTSGAMKALSGGITAGTGAAIIASGPLAPLTAAILAVSGAATGILKYFYDKKKKKNLRKDVTAEEMGIDWNTEMQNVREMFPDEDLSKTEIRAIILKGHGFEKGTRTAAFKEINKKRADHLLNVVKGGGEDATMARKVISALGVHRKNGRYAGGAAKLLAEKLGAG